MAWTDPTRLEVDLNQIASFRSFITKTSETLESESIKLMESVTELKNKGWNTPAGKKFTEKFGTGWVDEVTAYVATLKAIDSLLEIAVTNYQEVIDAAEELKF